MTRRITLGHPTVLKLKEFQGSLDAGPLGQMVGRLADSPQKYTTIDSVYDEIRRTLKACKAYQPDQRLVLVGQLEQLLEILRIEGSDGLLDNWLHGILL